MSCFAGERSGTSECVELHVFLVPDELWNSRLNTASVEAVDRFISAGFIRVYPDTVLKAVRDELGVLLGPERVADRYFFLKCVGRSLALVKPRQEKDLKAKSFAPPYSLYPELYLLPVEEHGSSVSSRSLSPDLAIYNADSQTGYPPRPAFAPGQTKEPTKFPLIKQGPQLSVLDQSLEDEDTSSSLEEREEEDSVGCEDPIWTETHNMCKSVQEELRAKQSVAEMLPIKQSLTKMEKTEKKTHYKRNLTRDSGVPESLEDPDAGFFLSQARKSKLSQTLKPTGKKPNDQTHAGRPEPLVPVECEATPSAPALAVHMQKTNATSTNRDELLKELKLAKEKRQQLERSRQELLRKGKDLLALNRHRRNQARDKWKRKYFDTKKATAPLEEALKSLRQELEAFYDKLFQQLQARDGRNRQKRAGKPSSTKNDLIIQIMTESCEIDNLKKNLDDAKMKLATEIKLRKQATTELRALKAELLQKKSQCSVSGSLLSAADLGSQIST
ncbi:spermatogenesis-associated protein 1 [Pygocentrus nattereri]|uniref:spermatogenesis-associated protein 1 n=1 Tax=Pygocentrus nattereri TaxID=42514 RepID=UPI001890DE83|nr:spermatogenesis-associated protein 1 [Pygocentrus nattereri]